MSRVLAWGQVCVSVVKEKSRAVLSDKHKVRIRLFWGLGASFTMLFLSFFQVIPAQVGWGQIMIVVAFGTGASCMLLRKDQFWIIAVVAGSVFWPMWLVAPYWDAIRIWIAQRLWELSKVNPVVSDGARGSAQYALAAVFSCLVGIELARVSFALEFVERYKKARKFYGRQLSAIQSDEVAEAWLADALKTSGLSLEVRVLLWQGETSCLKEMEAFTKRATERLGSKRYEQRKVKTKKR